MRIGRNDPCYCGSGKKYKKCCLENPVKNATELLAYQAELASRSKVKNRLKDAVDLNEETLHEMFFEMTQDNPWLEEEAIEDILNNPNLEELIFYQTDAALLNHVFNTYQSWNQNEQQKFLSNINASEGERDYLEKVITSQLSFLEILECRPDENIAILEDIFTKETYPIFDLGLSAHGQINTILSGRVVPYKNDFYLLETPGQMTIPKQYITLIIEAVNEEIKLEAKKNGKRKGIQPREVLTQNMNIVPWISIYVIHLMTNPIVKTSDGDEIKFTDAIYYDSDREHTIAKLEKIIGFEVDRDESGKVDIIWIDKDNTLLGNIEFSEGLMQVSTNSMERFNKFNKIADKIKSLKLRDIQTKSLADAMEEYSDYEEGTQGDLDLLPDELEEIIHGSLKIQYTKWMDEKVPMLGNKTPRNLAKTQKGKNEVEKLLQYYESQNERLPEDNPQHNFSFDFIRKELNL